MIPWNRARTVFAFVLIASLLLPTATAFAAETGPATPPPVPVFGPRLAPPVNPVTSVIAPATVYNNLLVPPGLPPQSTEADEADGGRLQEKPGRGIRQTSSAIAYGLELHAAADVCNDFNGGKSWAGVQARSDIWTDWYMGWAPFAVDNGYYQAKNVTFAMERSVGPGTNYGAGQSLKIHADHQPYAAGVGSPLIPIPAGYEGGQVTVSVKYLIWDHDQGGGEDGDGMDYDWASLGVKPNAWVAGATYVNGYVRGEWAEMTNTVNLVPGAREIMVLLQAHSPGSFNSQIYFDDVKIAFIGADGVAAYVADCKLAQ